MTITKVPADGTTVRAYLARPAAAQAPTGLTVAHELLGVNPDTRGVADDLAVGLNSDTRGVADDLAGAGRLEAAGLTPPLRPRGSGRRRRAQPHPGPGLVTLDRLR